MKRDLRLKVSCLLLATVLAIVLLGCNERESNDRKPRVTSAEASPQIGVVKEHQYKSARIQLGMTKAEVLEQVSPTGGEPTKPYYANVDPKSLLGKDEWGLRFGRSWADGGGCISLWFINGKVSQIKVDRMR